MALSSPGVEVSVIDESFYTPAEPGTVPLIIVASAENKSNGSGTGTAPGTLAANAGEVYLVTSQRDLSDTFGDPIFKTDASGNPVHAGEQNEYGLQAAYSLLGVSNRAYVVRANVDLGQLDASADEPSSDPAGGTHWLDTVNSKWGIFEWNGAAITTSGGQKFTNKVPIVITDSTKIAAGGGPKTSVGAIGDYAIVATDISATTTELTIKHDGAASGYENQLWFKTAGNAPGTTAGSWVEVGSTEWFLSWPVATGTASNPTLVPSTFLINSVVVTVSGTTVASAAAAVIAAGVPGVTAAVVNGKLAIYCNGDIGSEAEDSSASNAVIIDVNPAAIVASTALLTALGFTPGATKYAPRLVISKHTSVPAFKTTDTNPRPTGSIWIKTTEVNLGARLRVSRWNSTTEVWDALTCPIYANGHDALYNMDESGGGANLETGAIYAQYNHSEDDGVDATPRLATFKIYKRGASGATTIRSAKITTQVNAGTYSFAISESLSGQATLDTYKVVSYTAVAAASDADTLAAAINAAGFTNITASVDSQNRVSISHSEGGDFRIKVITSGAMSEYGFTAYDYEPSSGTYGQGTQFLQAAPAGDAFHTLVASNWEPLVYAASESAPARIPLDGQKWYSSVVDEVDLMIHNGEAWVGYKYDGSSGVSNIAAPYYANGTDPEGPIVSATAPTTQADGVTALVTGDLWIDTSDLENYPNIYKFNAALTNLPLVRRWVLLDKTDQSSEDGVLFAVLAIIQQVQIATKQEL